MFPGLPTFRKKKTWNINKRVEVLVASSVVESLYSETYKNILEHISGTRCIVRPMESKQNCA